MNLDKQRADDYNEWWKILSCLKKLNKNNIEIA